MEKGTTIIFFLYDREVWSFSPNGKIFIACDIYTNKSVNIWHLLKYGEKIHLITINIRIVISYYHLTKIS